MKRVERIFILNEEFQVSEEGFGSYIMSAKCSEEEASRLTGALQAAVDVALSKKEKQSSH